MTYLDHRKTGRPSTRDPASTITHSWRDHTRLNLAQHYDADRVNRIMAGADPRTQADIARWNSLGQRSAA